MYLDRDAMRRQESRSDGGFGEGERGFETTGRGEGLLTLGGRSAYDGGRYFPVVNNRLWEMKRGREEDCGFRIADCGLKDDDKRQTTMTKNETAKSHIDMFSRDP